MNEFKRFYQPITIKSADNCTWF